jgi:bacterioferritin (cytochrome b1)
MTAKELSYLNDVLNSEKVIITKYHDYANQLVDPNLKNLCNQVVSKHVQNYNSLFSQLNS